MNYDSTQDTNDHISSVRKRVWDCVINLLKRGDNHDLSKLESPEKELFDEYTPKLKDSTYGSDEYKGFLKGLKVALDHHYENNSHHPEHYENGISGMSLLDLLEMICDWKAATERHADGDISKSIEINQQRFGYTDELKSILKNTAKELGYLQ